MQNHCCLSPVIVNTTASINLVLSMCQSLCRDYLILPHNTTPSVLSWGTLWQRGEGLKSNCSGHRGSHPWSTKRAKLRLFPLLLFLWKHFWTEVLSAGKRFDSETFPKGSLSTQGKLQWASQSERRAFSGLFFQCRLCPMLVETHSLAGQMQASDALLRFSCASLPLGTASLCKLLQRRNNLRMFLMKNEGLFSWFN